MPPVVNTLSELMLLTAGGVLWWLGGVIRGWLKKATNRRRAEVDTRARLEKKIHDLQSEVYSYRTVMLESGHWTLETLPDFRKHNSSTGPTKTHP